MPGFLSSLNAIGTGLGQGAEAIRQQQQAAAQVALQRLALQQAQSRQQGMAAGLAGLVAAYGGGRQQQPQQPPGPPSGFTGPGYTTPPPAGPGMPMMPPAASPVAQGGGADPTYGAGLRTMFSLEGDRPGAVGAAGELGPGQVLPSTGRQYGFSPDQLMNSREPGTAIYGDLYRRSGGDARAALVGYNRGPGAMAAYQKAGDNPAAVPNLAPAYKNAIGAGLTGAGQAVVRNFAQNMPPEVLQQGNAAANAAAQQFDPMEYGRVEMQRAFAAIDQQDIPPEAKMLAITEVAKILRPEDRMMLSMYMMQNRDLRAGAAQEQRAHLGEERLEVERQRLADQEAKGAGGGGTYEASKTLEILDKDGNVVRTVLAREGRGKVGWVDSTSGDPLKLDQGQQVREVTPSASSGGRTGAQVLRQEIGGREVLSDLQNAVSLEIGQTTGMLGTVQQGTSIIEALKGDTVRSLTSQDAQLMQASMASLSRELSILMSPVYGGNWAAQQIDPLIPKSGDTIGTTQFKMARLAQSADNALEALEKSPALSNDQKQYAKGLREEIQEAIPWSTAEALGFARFAGEGESFSAFTDRWRKNIPGGSKPVSGKTVNGMPVFKAPDGSFHSLDAAPDASHP